MQSVLLQKSYSLNEFARLNDIAFTTVRGEIKSGRLVARKIGRRTIITSEDAKAWQERLPKSPIFNVNSKAVAAAGASKRSRGRNST